MATEAAAAQGGAKKVNRGLIAVILVGVVVIGVLVGVIVMLLNRPEPETEPENRSMRATVINEDNVVEEVQRMVEEDYVAPGYYEVTQTMDWVFPDGESASTNAYVENAESNTNAVYFDVALRNTAQIIYASPVLPVGTYLDEIVLDTDLDPGSYDCTLTYHLVDDDQNDLSTLTLALMVRVDG